MTSPHSAIFVTYLWAVGICIAAIACLYVLYWYVVPPSWRRPTLILAAAVILVGAFGPGYVLFYSAIIVATFVFATPGKRSRIAPIVSVLVACYAGLFVFASLMAQHRLPRLGPFGQTDPFLVAHLMGAYSLVRLIVYTREVCTGQTPCHGFVSFLTYVTFFPSFFMGPITRYGAFCEGARTEGRSPCRDHLRKGLWKLLRSGLMAMALALVLALIGYVTRDGTFLEPGGHFVTWEAWALTCLFTPLWFTGFSVYTDLAIGLGSLFGYTVPENFRGVAFLKQNISEWWRTWHMTMSFWVRDYLYIPLGGSRRHPTFNFTAAFVVCGLWHMPLLHFALWGFANGGALAVHRLSRQWRGRRYGTKPPSKIGRMVAYAITFVCFGLTWPFFIYPADQALAYYALLVGVRL